MSRDADRVALQVELDKAKAALGSGAASRKKRAKDLRDAVVNTRRLRSSDRSQTVISFRGSQSLKQRLAQRRATSRANGETFNMWMERIIVAALDAEEREGV